jgi:hypothetical protein
MRPNGGAVVQQTKKWSDRSPLEKRAVIAVSTVSVAVTTWAAVDLILRDSVLVRGPKLLWFGALVVQPVGPVGYLFFGRK